MKDWKPTANLKALRLRAELYALVRHFFAERGVLEVETPVMSSAGNTDPNIESFQLGFDGPKTAGAGARWLRTSPEFPLKRLLAAGVGDCYELGRVFRNGEAGKRHNPEFTMLEWYRIGYDHHRLMDETSELLKSAMALAGRRATVRDTSFRQLYLDKFGFDPLTAPEEELRSPLGVYGIDPAGRRTAAGQPAQAAGLRGRGARHRPADDGPDGDRQDRRRDGVSVRTGMNRG